MYWFRYALESWTFVHPDEYTNTELRSSYVAFAEELEAVAVFAGTAVDVLVPTKVGIWVGVFVTIAVAARVTVDVMSGVAVLVTAIVGAMVAVFVAARVDVGAGDVEIVVVWLAGSTTTYPFVKSRRQVVPD